MNKKSNQRYLETERKIQECLIELLNKKDIDEITVSEICKKVQINRSTFYAHYLDLYDLLDKLQKYMNTSLINRYNKSELDERFFLSEKFFIPFLEYIRNNQSFYKACLKRRNKFPIEEGFEGLWNIVVKPICINRGIVSEEEMMYYFVYFQAGMTMLIKRWVDNGCIETPEQIWDYLKRCGYCFKDILS